MRRVTRRELLKLGAGAAVALGVPQLLAGCGGEGSPAKVPSVPEAKARVAAVRGDDLYAMTRDAMEAMGGAGRIVHEGETVFIKPNMSLLPFVPALGNRFVTGECTKPEIVIAVAEECLRAGASEVIVGDGSQLSTFDWALATTLDGSTNLAAEAARLSSTYKGKVTLACLDADSPNWLEIPSRAGLDKPLVVSSLVADADRVISVPVLKTHQWAQLTLSLKCSVWASSTKKTFTTLWTISVPARKKSRKLSFASISIATARLPPWFSTTSPVPIWKANTTRWASLAITGTGKRANCKSSLGCLPILRESRWRCACSAATPAILPPWPNKSRL